MFVHSSYERMYVRVPSLSSAVFLAFSKSLKMLKHSSAEQFAFQMLLKCCTAALFSNAMPNAWLIPSLIPSNCACGPQIGRLRVQVDERSLKTSALDAQLREAYSLTETKVGGLLIIL